MGTLFTPTRQDVERYQRLRAANRALSDKLIALTPKQAWEQIADAIGIRLDGILVFENESEMSALGDCLVYNWFQNGMNVVQQYASTHVMEPGSDEDVILQACLSAKYRILSVQSRIPGAGVYCSDMEDGSEIFLMDLALSQSAQAGYGMASRTLPVEDYWITGGAPLPFREGLPIEQAFEQLGRDYPDLIMGQDGRALAVVRACLADGAAEHVRFEGSDRGSVKRQRTGHLPPKKPRRRLPPAR
jgi:hypothetical protein